MKKYGIAFFLYAAVLCLAYYGSYQISYGYSRRENTAQLAAKDGETVAVEAGSEGILKSDTEYVIERYNRRTGEVQKVTEPLPLLLLGLDRNGAAAYAKTYSDDPGIEELEEGFEQMELVSFSEDRVIFRKIYLPWEKDYKYSLGIVDGHVVVYYMDNTTIYEYTDIVCSTLPQDLQRQIENRECLLDIHGLYDFLENYSS